MRIGEQETEQERTGISESSSDGEVTNGPDGVDGVPIPLTCKTPYIPFSVFRGYTLRRFKNSTAREHVRRVALLSSLDRHIPQPYPPAPPPIHPLQLILRHRSPSSPEIPFVKLDRLYNYLEIISHCKRSSPMITENR